MKTLEVRRHAFTKKGAARGSGSTLSAEGVKFARQVGFDMGPFEYVVASRVPRTLETALAMGLAVDELVEMGGVGWEQATAEIDNRSLRSEEDLYLRYVDRFATGAQWRSSGSIKRRSGSTPWVAFGRAVRPWSSRTAA